MTTIKTNNLRVSFVCLAIGLNICNGCTTNKIRKVSADEFIKAHELKGLPTDKFIGVTGKDSNGRAYKEISRFRCTLTGLIVSTEVLWCPSQELPPAFLENAKEQPYLEK